MDTSQVIEAIIHRQHGWAVAEQFEATFNDGEDFDNQNYNALEYIKNTIKDIIRSQVLNDNDIPTLERYLTDLEDYLNNDEVKAWDMLRKN